MKKINILSAFFALCFLSSFVLVAQSPQVYNYTGTIQIFEVPANVTSLTIETKGAQGGNDPLSTISAGLGAHIIGTVAVTPGQRLKVLVGQQGIRNGGGGGSFVVDSATNTPLVIAGGGGGSAQTSDSPGKHGQATTSGGTGGGGGGLGGTNGSGGFIGAMTFQSGAGGGLLTNGENGNELGGISFLNGGASPSVTLFGVGGFGGGANASGYIVGGGGGGYSGGGSGGNDIGGVGGGGGSFNAGTNQSNTAGVHTGNGQIIFTWVEDNNPCDPVSISFTASGLKAFWSPASDPYTFYYGLVDAKRINAIVSGGTGPFAYSWSNSGTPALLPRAYYPANSIDLFRPLAATTVTVEVTDLGTNCVYTESVFIDWDGQYFCQIVGNTWYINVCQGGMNACVPWTQGRDMLRSNPPTATLGNCPVVLKSEIGLESGMLTLYPNPGNGVLNLGTYINQAGIGALSVLDMRGNTIYAEALNLTEGVWEQTLELRHLASGTYIIRLQTNDNVITERFQIIN